MKNLIVKVFQCVFFTVPLGRQMLWEMSLKRLFIHVSRWFYRAITLPEFGMRVREPSTKEIASVVWSSSPNANNSNNAWNINFNNGNTNNNNRNNNNYVRLVRSGE